MTILRTERGFAIWRWVLLMCLATFAVATIQGSAAAQEEPKRQVHNSRGLTGVTPEREAAALKFVEQHHPALVELLHELKSSSPSEYGRAVRELFQTSERLARMKDRDTKSYELELKYWKLKSRCELLAARLQMEDTQSLRDQLRGALARKLDLQIAIMQHAREQLLEKVNKIDQNIAELKSTSEASIERRIQQAAAQRSARPANKLPRNAPAKKTPPTQPRSKT